MLEKQNPLVSIVIPTFNRAELIRETLRSVESQVYKNWECIVVDDHSTDNTNEILREFIRQDSRFKLLINNRKKGAQGARNTGLLETKGELLSFFDSDDLMHPERISRQVRYLQDNPKCDICTCYSHLLNDNHEITGAYTWITNGNILSDLLNGATYVDYNCALIRKSVIGKIGLLDEDCPSYQEWDTHIRLACVARYGTVNELLVSYCQRSMGRISTDSLRELHGFAYIYGKHKKLWIEVLGKNCYFSKVYSLKLKLSGKDKKFQKEMNNVLPDLRSLPFEFRIKILLKKIWHLL